MHPFVVLNLAALAFWALCVSYRFIWAFIGVGDSKALPSILAGIAGSPLLVSQTVLFVVLVMLLHVALASAWYLAWHPVHRRLWPHDTRPGQRALLAFLPVLLAVLALNLQMYPESLFAAEIGTTSGPAVMALTVVLVGYVGVVAFTALAIWICSPHRRGTKVTAATIVSIAALAIIGARTLIEPSLPERRNAPDVIFVGFDSLRTETIARSPDLVPEISAFLRDAAHVQDAWTPMGRTFPAMLSLFTGRYPVSHGARFNLISRDVVDDASSLVHELRASDYQTMYAIDETRFSNIDESFGFDHIVAPSIGAFDFLAGAMDDLPLVNLVMNTRAGRLLFPHVHLNRAMPVTYRPGVFDRSVGRAIGRLDNAKPAFIAVHFELPHWPYRWADITSADAPVDPDGSTPWYYRAAVAESDAQFGRLLRSLHASGRLENAVVVLYTDHGEAFRTSEPRFARQPDGDGSLTVHAGHGTHVFSGNQFRTLLAFRGFGRISGRIDAGAVTGVTVSLADVAPTVADLLEIPLSPVDGASLVTLLDGNASDAGFRAVPLETGFTPSSVAAGSPNTRDLVTRGLASYDIVSDGRLSLSESAIQGLMAEKQRAVVSGHWVLGAIPGATGEIDYLLADLERHLVWDADGALPADAPVRQLWESLCRWFAEDSVAIGRQCLAPVGRATMVGPE